MKPDIITSAFIVCGAGIVASSAFLFYLGYLGLKDLWKDIEEGMDLRDVLTGDEDENLMV